MPYIPPISNLGGMKKFDSAVEGVTKDLSETSLSTATNPHQKEEEGEQEGEKDTTGESEENPGNTMRSDSTPSLCTTDISESEGSNSVISLDNAGTGSETEVGLEVEEEDEEQGGKDEIMKYKLGMIAYTRDLYQQAKLSESRKAKTAAAYGQQFGLKQSGMEKMAAKKALTKRLNG